jgi:hypothetical protein
MKSLLPVPCLIAPLLLTLTASGLAAPPTITLTTPALNLNTDIVIIGTATDTAETATADGRTARAGIKEVRYQIEGSTKWRKAQLTGKNASSTGWLIPYENKSAVGKRITFYAVDRSGQGSAYISTRFKKSTTNATTATPTPTPTPTPDTTLTTN